MTKKPKNNAKRVSNSNGPRKRRSIEERSANGVAVRRPAGELAREREYLPDAGGAPQPRRFMPPPEDEI